MKRFFTLFFWLLCIACDIQSRADTITFSMTNAQGQADNTPILLNPVSSYVQANGTYQTRGFPFWIYPTNGFVSTNLGSGFWIASNAVMISTLAPSSGGTFQGFIFNVISNGNNSTYPFTTFPLGGYNFYRPIVGQQTIIITNANVGTITNGVGTNGQMVLTSGGTIFVGTNNDVFGSASGATNGLFPNAGPFAGGVNTNRFDTNAAGAQAFTSASNALVVATNTVMGLIASAGGTITQGVSTNGQAVTTAGNTIYVGTNNDVFGAAKAATNAMGQGSGMAAFSQTNQFDGAGAGTAAAFAATNALFPNAGPFAGGVNTNRFDTNSAGNQAFIAASNMIAAGTAGPFVNYKNGSATNLTSVGVLSIGPWQINTNQVTGGLILSNAPSYVAITNSSLIYSNGTALGNQQVNGNSTVTGNQTVTGIANLGNGSVAQGTFTITVLDSQAGQLVDSSGNVYFNEDNELIDDDNSPGSAGQFLGNTGPQVLWQNLNIEMLGPTNGSGSVVLSKGPVLTNATVSTLTVTNLLYVGGALFQQSLSVLGITNSTAQGTYLWYPIPAAYSNVNNQAWVLLSNTICTFQSNGVSFYNNSTLLGQYSAVVGAAGPFPLVNEGGFFWHQGWLTLGPVLPGGDTNTWFWITNEAGQFAITAYQSGSNLTVNATNSLYAGLTNLFSGWITNSTISPASVTNQAGFWAASPASSGGTTANAFLTNNPGAFPNVNAPNSIITSSNDIVLGLLNAIDIGTNGVPLLQIGVFPGTSSHFIFGATNNSLNNSPTGPGNDTGQNDAGVGVLGGNWNNITDSSQNHMFSEYIFGGWSNAISTIALGNPTTTFFTNNDIFASIYSSIDFNSGGAPATMTASDNQIYDSMGSAITNNNLATAPFAFYYNLIFHGSNSVIFSQGSKLYDAVAMGRNITDSNSDAWVMSDGSANVSTATNNQLILQFGNGVGINTNFAGTNALSVSGPTLLSGNVYVAGQLINNGTNTAITSATAGQAQNLSLGNGGNGTGISIIGGQGSTNFSIANGGTVNQTSGGLAEGGNAGNIFALNGGSVTNSNNGSGGNGGNFIGGFGGSGIGTGTNGIGGTFTWGGNLNVVGALIATNLNASAVNGVPVTNGTITVFPINGTNTITFAGWGVAFLNTTFTWNPAFNIDGSGGAYTNSNNQIYYFDVGGAIDVRWILATNNPSGIQSGVDDWYVGQSTPQNSSWIADAATFSSGIAIYPSTQTMTNLNILNYETAANTVHVFVATNGWTSPYGWFSESSAGQSLQDALSFYAQWSPSNQVPNAADSNYSFSSNYVGMSFELGPAPPWGNPFYLPQGFVIDDRNASASWEIYGQGPQTCVLGDSNVLRNLLGSTLIVSNQIGGPLPLENIHGILFCESNYVRKAVAVNLYGAGELNFWGNYITAYQSWNPGVYYLGWNGGDAAGTHVVPGYKPGWIDLMVCGNNGLQRVHDNIIAGGATGIIIPAEHVRLHDNIFKFIGNDTSVYQNQWASNDTTLLATTDAGTINGSDISLGAAVLISGAGDVRIDGDYDIASCVGVYIKNGTKAGMSYGPDKFSFMHFEALVTGPWADFVMATNQGTHSLNVVVQDCADGANSSSLPVDIYTLANNGVLSTSIGTFQSTKAYVMGLTSAAQSAPAKYVVLTNNVNISSQ